MRKISFEYFAEQEAKSPGRRCFAQNTGIQKNKKPGSCKSFSVRFKESIALVYETETPYSLRYNPVFDNYWHPLHSDHDTLVVEEWEKQQGTRVFLRDCLSCSIALDFNFENNTSGKHTSTGQLEENAKHKADSASIEALVVLFMEAIVSLPHYNSATVIAAVPPRPGKAFDLPSKLAARLAEEFGLNDVTPLFGFDGTKGQTKDMPYDKRWEAWTAAGLGMQKSAEKLLKDQAVILIDDKYQSGVSANFVAMILQQHGAAEVYGLYAVKTLRDKDNS